MTTEKLEGETSEDYVKRLFIMADTHIDNIEAQFMEMKEKGIVGFCNECGCNIYIDRKHICSFKSR